MGGEAQTTVRLVDQEEHEFRVLMAHCDACPRCARAREDGLLLNPGALCAEGRRYGAAWDEAEQAIADTVIAAVA